MKWIVLGVVGLFVLGFAFLAILAPLASSEVACGSATVRDFMTQIGRNNIEGNPVSKASYSPERSTFEIGDVAQVGTTDRGVSCRATLTVQADWSDELVELRARDAAAFEAQVEASGLAGTVGPPFASTIHYTVEETAEGLIRVQVTEQTNQAAVPAP